MSQRARVPRHIAIIMDGNGRWARQRHLPRLAGHRAGTENIRRIVTECAEQGVQYLTLYAFSTENWSRPSAEVDGLMRILSDFIDRETINLHREGARLRHLGRLENISAELRQKILDAIELTRHNTRITLAVAFNYGGRADIVDAVRELIALGVKPEDVTEAVISDHLSTRGMPDPDLIIRTSGEWRLSNFLIWQAAYSEYWTTPVYWPDFSPEHLRQAIYDYGQRERRFGGLSEES
ncbi:MULTISPECIES: isoprenyl transferase [unclassified Roseiflexus]|jgi:undecaprenyl diphosphate synthase|uniref:isoprenyl transferase n=1 Tax=unclassified Roseiflexus TaxID=2609473 RepID=UPI0000D8131B|nr:MULTISPECIES: isoprenyl transferase [unclassified Roseiflexus]ABQ90401.1 Undecaprenyl pyrophosphate synthetase [Roseiflexus sp. RS-1]MBO9321392.1 isoprenyl transferase [Roseiflexus sp.]MCL6542182.1 isoprenyl transferase [Roseiflexus sp.]